MLEIKHKDNATFLVFKDTFAANKYYVMNLLFWTNIGIRLQPVCWSGYMNAFELVKAV